jgi:hypothetical protein
MDFGTLLQYVRDRKKLALELRAEDLELIRRECLTGRRECGGNFTISSLETPMDVYRLKIDRWVYGEYASLQLPRSAIEFHTHPKRCLNANTCAVPVPSPQDVVNMFVGFSNETTLLHFLMTSHWLYAMVVSKSHKSVGFNATALADVMAIYLRPIHDLYTNSDPQPSTPFAKAGFRGHRYQKLCQFLANRTKLTRQGYLTQWHLASVALGLQMKRFAVDIPHVKVTLTDTDLGVTVKFDALVRPSGTVSCTMPPIHTILSALRTNGRGTFVCNNERLQLHLIEDMQHIRHNADTWNAWRGLVEELHHQLHLFFYGGVMAPLANTALNQSQYTGSLYSALVEYVFAPKVRGKKVESRFRALYGTIWNLFGVQLKFYSL